MDLSAPLPLDLHDQALLLTTVLRERENAPSFLQCLPENRRQPILNVLDGILAMPPKPRIGFILERYKYLLTTDHRETIQYVHPGWVARLLTGEPPLLAGLVLKSLPSPYRKRLAAELPATMLQDIQAALRGIVPSMAAQAVFIAVLARHFDLDGLFPGRGACRFDAVFSLQPEELQAVLEEAGSAELAMACQNLSTRDQDSICRKLPPLCQDKVRRKMSQYAGTPPGRIDRARQSFLHLKDELYQKGRLIEFTGLHILSAALAGYPAARSRCLAFKLIPADGDTLLALHRRPQQEGDGTFPALVRDEIAGIITYLSEIDRIRSFWKYFD